MTQIKRKPLRHSKEIIAQKRAQNKAITQRKAHYVNRLGKENTETAEASLGSNIRLQPLFRSNPKLYSTYKHYKNRSFTDSLEAYQYGVAKEVKILRRNNRPPTKAVVLNFLKELSVAEIKKYRDKIFRTLRKAGIQAVVAIELTRAIPRIGKPNNRVHFHFLTDEKGSGERSEKEFRDLFNKACQDSGLGKKDFRIIDYKDKIEDGDWYFDYFTKFDRKNEGKYGENENTDEDNDGDWNWRTVLLFEQGLGLHKFYQIGKWFKKPKTQLWKEIRVIAETKRRKESEAEEAAAEAKMKAKAKRK
jgi:hypothetical protein